MQSPSYPEKQEIIEVVFKMEVDHYLPVCYTNYLHSSVILQIYVISTTTSHSNQEHSPQPVKEESKR